VLPSTGASRHVPAITSVGRGAAGARAVVATVTTRRPAAVALVAARLVYTPVSICDSITQAERQTVVTALLVFVLHGDDVVVG
jgi:hypothetical protein